MFAVGELPTPENQSEIAASTGGGGNEIFRSKARFLALGC